MKKMQEQKKPFHFPTSVAISLIVGLILFLIALPYLRIVPDGSEKFSGKEKIAAQRALELVRLTNGPGFSRPIERVLAVEQTSSERYCHNDPNSDDIKIKYAVTMEETFIFGLQYHQYEIRICDY